MKQIVIVQVGTGDEVAPHAGAWIETAAASCSPAMLLSPLMRGRGLKHLAKTLCAMRWMSPLMRGRGLKQGD